MPKTKNSIIIIICTFLLCWLFQYLILKNNHPKSEEIMIIVFDVNIPLKKKVNRLTRANEKLVSILAKKDTTMMEVVQGTNMSCNNKYKNWDIVWTVPYISSKTYVVKTWNILYYIPLEDVYVISYDDYSQKKIPSKHIFDTNKSAENYCLEALWYL